jgi:hypothetical protein
MSDKRNLAIIVLVGLCLFLHNNQSAPAPRKPIREAIAKALAWLPWIAPFVLDEPHPAPDDMRYHTPVYAAGEPPTRELGPDQHEIVDFGDNW